MDEEHNDHVERVLIGRFKVLRSPSIKVGVVGDQVEAYDKLPEGDSCIEVNARLLLLESREELLEVSHAAHPLDETLCG